MKTHIKILLALLLVFCGTKVNAADYLIGAGDVLQIKVYGYDDLSSSVHVSDDGHIVFPFIGQVDVSGKTEFDVAHDIAQLMERGGYIQNASVTVTVYEYKSQQISILGQVKAPGIYILKTKNSLADMLALAGGLSEMGDNRVIVTRKINGQLSKQEVDLKMALEYPEKTPTFYVQKGDVIYVPKMAMFYIFGEVKTAGTFRLEPNMTVAQAISLGGGLTPRGTLNGIVIRRQDDNGVVQEIDVELSDQVQKNDVIIIDERWF